MRLLVFLQSMTLNALWLFCTIVGVSIAYYGFQNSVLWGLGGILAGFLVAGVLFAIGKVVHKVLFGMMYSIFMPKELKAAFKDRRNL